MRRWIEITFLLILTSFIASSQEKDRIFVCRNGRVNFISDAPLEMIKASNEKLSGVLNASERSFSFQVPSKSFEGFNSSLQKVHFNEDYIESDLFPFSTFKGKIIEEIDFNVPGEHKIRAKGKLNIHGVEIDRIIRCNLNIRSNQINVDADFTVFIADHNISIPSILNQKIAKEVKVSVRFIMEPAVVKTLK